MSKHEKTFWNKTKKFFLEQSKTLNKTSFEKVKVNSLRGLNGFFAPESRPKVHRIFAFSSLVVTVIFLIPILIELIGSFIPAKKNYSNNRSETSLDFIVDTTYRLDEFAGYLERLKQHDPFKTIHQGDSSSLDQLKVCEEASRQSSLPINLDSTIVMQDPLKSLAAVQSRNKNKITAYRISEKIDSMARVDQIERLRVIFRNLQNGQCEYIANSSFDPKRQAVRLMDPATAQQYLNSQDRIEGIKNDGNNFQISRTFIKSKLTDLNSILTQARAIPLTNPDGTMSFRIEEVEPGGLFSHLNISNGDVITKINGQPITSMNEIMGLMNQLGTVSAVNITVLRNGSENSMQYNFVEQ